MKIHAAYKPEEPTGCWDGKFPIPPGVQVLANRKIGYLPSGALLTRVSDSELYYDPSLRIKGTHYVYIGSEAPYYVRIYQEG